MFTKINSQKVGFYISSVLLFSMLIGLAIYIQTARAAPPTTVVYDALPSPLPPNVASLGFQATSTSQFGDYIHLAGTDRLLDTVTVTMSDWALYSDYSSDIRYSSDSVNWTHPITLNIYNVVPGAPNTVGSLLATVTETVTIPWRPVADPTCPGGTAWRAGDSLCYNGFAFNLTFDLSSLNVILPDDIIVGVAYDTQTYGASPIGLAGPYNSLNVGIASGQTANVGTDDNADNLFWDTIYPSYTAGFKEDIAWTPNGTVNFQITARVDCTGTSDCYVDAVNGNDANGGASISDPKKTIQAGIDAVAPGGTVHVLPGAYDETATNRLVLGVNGPHDFGLFINKTGVSIIGVDSTDTPITDYNSLQAHVTTNATNNFGYSGIFVEGDDVTIAGLDILDNLPSNNKTIEIIGDNFTLENSHINVSDGGSVYFNDWQFDDNGTPTDLSDDTSYIQSYTINHNWIDLSASIDLTSGAGLDGFVSDRQITNNKFINDNFWPSISFNGSDTGVPWFVYSVGGAEITGNDFTNTYNMPDDTSGHIRARGTYDNSQFDWTSYWEDNTFNKATVTLIGAFPPFDVRTYSYPGGYGTYNDVRRIGVTIQGEVDHAVASDTVLVNQGTYVEQVTVPLTLDLLGEDGAALTTIMMPDPQAGDRNLVTITGAGVSVEMSGFTVAGPATGPLSCAGTLAGILVRDDAFAEIHHNHIKDIADVEGGTPPFSGCQHGFGIIVGDATLGTNGTANIHDNVIDGYQKGGIVVGNNTAIAPTTYITNNTVTGFGTQTKIAQNGIQISDGAVGIVTGNTVTDHLCDHATCGPDPITDYQSAGILLFDPGAGTDVSGNTVSNNDVGIYNYDTSVNTSGAPVIDGNTLVGNRYEGIFLDQGNPTVSNNELSGTSNIGIAVVSFDVAAYGITGDSNGIVKNNKITNAGVGISLIDETLDAYFPTITANHNSITGNTAGFTNPIPPTVDAQENWWGSASGPSGVGPGTGDSVSANVDFDPWLCDGTDTSPAIGFQPNVITLCTGTPSPTPIPTDTPSNTPVPPTFTHTNTPTKTLKPSKTPINTATRTNTPTNTPVGPSPTFTVTNTPDLASPTFTAINTPTKTATPTRTVKPTKTPLVTPTVIACTGNLLQNPSFELPLIPVQNIQYWVELPSEGSITQGGGYQADGSNNAFIGPNERLYQDVNASAGNTYTVTFWSGTHDPSQNETVKLEFLNSSNVVIGSQSVNIDYDVDTDTIAPRVTQYTLQGIAPAGTVKVRVIAYNDGNNTFKFDAACLK